MFSTVLRCSSSFFGASRASSHQGASEAEFENIMLIDGCAAAAENMMLAARSLGIGKLLDRLGHVSGF